MLNAYRQSRGARPCVVATTWTVPLALQRPLSKQGILNLRKIVETGRQRLVTSAEGQPKEVEICPYPITVGRKNKPRGFSRG